MLASVGHVPLLTAKSDVVEELGTLLSDRLKRAADNANVVKVEERVKLV